MFDGGSIPENAPSGRNLIVACQLAVCNSTTIAENFDQPAIAAQAFRLPSRIDDIDIAEVVAPDGDGVSHLDVGWSDPLASPADVVNIVVRKDGKEMVELKNGMLSESIDLFRFLDTDREGMELYKPTLGSFIAPGLPRYLLDYPPLETGDYTVEVYLNGVLEASEEVSVGQ